ncbi:MAG: hypothetical protein JNM17_15250 [Archangium sp.]|nr:hypothetical protein [Archangium sp.]
MSGDGKKPPPKPIQPAPGVAPGSGARRAAHGTGDSAFELTPVGKPGQSLPSLPRVATAPGTFPALTGRNPFGSDERTHTSTPSLPKVSSSNLPKVGGSGASSNNLPAVGGPVPGLTQGMPKRKTNVIQKQLASSAFDKDERTQTEALMGRAKSVELDLDEEGDGLNGQFYDGETAAKEVSTKSTWRALKAPVKSKSKKRSPRVLWTVIDQFAVGTNPRYVPSKPGESRAHVFAWDVSMAMDCEIPHYKLGREMTFMATVDWVRFKSTEQGWRRLLDKKAAVEAADRGELVLMISKDPKVWVLAVVRPGGAGDDGHPRVASAGSIRGNDLSAAELLGASDGDFYSHD